MTTNEMEEKRQSTSARSRDSGFESMSEETIRPGRLTIFILGFIIIINNNNIEKYLWRKNISLACSGKDHESVLCEFPHGEERRFCRAGYPVNSPWKQSNLHSWQGRYHWFLRGEVFCNLFEWEKRRKARAQLVSVALAFLESFKHVVRPCQQEGRRYH